MKARALLHSALALNARWKSLRASALWMVSVLSLASIARAQVATPFCFGDGTDSIGNCPCTSTAGNQNGAPGHGCKNSTTGSIGGLMSTAGNACVTATCGPDTLTFTGTGLLPTGFSVLLQGSVDISPHVFLGDGIRCVGGTLKRLYVANAVAGTVVYPPPPGTPSISARSAALGDLLTAGSVRYYQIFYRDPVAAFCPPGLVNLTNGFKVTWR